MGAKVKKAPFRAVVVSWLDAHSEDQWLQFDPKNPPTINHHRCETAGYLILEDDKYLGIAGTVGEDPENPGTYDATGILFVPKGMVLEVKDQHAPSRRRKKK